VTRFSSCLDGVAQVEGLAIQAMKSPNEAPARGQNAAQNIDEKGSFKYVKTVSTLYRTPVTIVFT
jgi:hypothetical protein